MIVSTKFTNRIPVLGHALRLPSTSSKASMVNIRGPYLFPGAPSYEIRWKRRLGGACCAHNIILSVDNEEGDCFPRHTTAVVYPTEEEHAFEAVQALKSGKVIAVPTDTLYGFACDACFLDAVSQIYAIKGRKLTSPLAICVGDVSDISRFAVTDYLPDGLLDSLLPGPVTVVLQRGESSILEKSLNPGIDSIGVRVPDSHFIRVLCRGLGSALALTSANLSGHPSSVCINDFETLWKHCASVYDGGVLPSGRAAGSTIVDLTKAGLYRILRPGSALGEMVEVMEKHCLTNEDTMRSIKSTQKMGY